MTANPDFLPSQDGDNAAEYPTAFGITFTPTVSGALLGVLGLLGAAYLGVNMVLPAWDQYQTLQNDVKNKQEQIKQQEQLQNQLAQAKVNLNQAKQQKTAVMSMFGNEKNLDTIMLDINRFVRARSAKLTKFEPAPNDASTPNSSGVITDSSLGAEVNGKLKHKVYNVVFEGDYGQTQSVMRSLERLQQLLLVKDYKARMLESETQQKVVVNRQGKIIPSGKPNNRTLIENSFKLEVLLPLTAEEAKQAAAAAAPPPAQ
ncbi:MULTISPECIES: hypothetical protein [Cyanophyceae]|uniref:hypothetical protein n=1 Tax=Cyanophyceae TaxID=3028117 RepID=UPI001687A5E2|nr:hypothetical protein [Trichocoleus sp. FACHB-69]MBD1934297.1 hypothetical protein [Trichocoleus sp. FACHB-69]